MNINLTPVNLSKLDKLFEENTKVSSKACETIVKSNGQIPKAFRKKDSKET